MAHNTQRAARMVAKSTAQLVALYTAKTLSSAAAAHELKARGVALPVREPAEPRFPELAWKKGERILPASS